MSDSVWVWLVGVRASLNRESFPWQKVLAVVPNVPVVILPLVVVMSGRFAVEPICPLVFMSPIFCFDVIAPLVVVVTK